MKQYHCKNSHPTRPRECGKWLLAGDFDGEITVFCKKCGQPSTVDGRDMYTTAQVDNAVLTV